MIKGGDFMTDVITLMLELFGLSGVPVTFSEFIWWCVRLIAGVSLVKFFVAMPFSFINKMNERR